MKQPQPHVTKVGKRELGGNQKFADDVQTARRRIFMLSTAMKLLNMLELAINNNDRDFFNTTTAEKKSERSVPALLPLLFEEVVLIRQLD
jgi:hypothetical protein